MKAAAKKSLPRPAGPRSEVSILLPGALILLVLLSTFALFSYRSTLALLVGERRAEAELLARRLAVTMAQEGWTTSEILKQRAPGARQVAVLDASGWPVIGGSEAGAAEAGDVIAGEAPFQAGGRAYRVRVDLPAGLLLGKQRGLEVLIPWILCIDAALLGLVFLSMRRLLLPIDELLAKARRLTFKDPAPPAEPDEVRFLSSTFDRAVEEIADLTEAYRRSREERLAESLRQLGELTAGVAHEMRNSIGTLKGYVALIDRDPERRMLDENLAEIRREGDHLHRVLEDFLSFARPGSVRLAQVDLRQTLQRALEDPALGGQACRLEVEPGHGWEVAGDAQLLERALRNLLSNAAGAQERAGRAGEKIEVSLARRGELIEIAVKDCGEGIPDELLPRLFEPFSAGHPKGVGLGLALTRRILLLHDGAIEVVPAREGEQGTTVRVTLPAAARHGGSVTESSAAEDKGEPFPRRMRRQL
jgi:signal transduction histidine kinase